MLNMAKLSERLVTTIIDQKGFNSRGRVTVRVLMIEYLLSLVVTHDSFFIFIFNLGIKNDTSILANLVRTENKKKHP